MAKNVKHFLVFRKRSIYDLANYGVRLTTSTFDPAVINSQHVSSSATMLTRRRVRCGPLPGNWFEIIWQVLENRQM